MCSVHILLSIHNSNIILKFANDEPVIRHITDNKEDGVGEDVHNLTWYANNNSILNIPKTKEIIVGFRTTKRIKQCYTPIQRLQRASGFLSSTPSQSNFLGGEQ